MLIGWCNSLLGIAITFSVYCCNTGHQELIDMLAKDERLSQSKAAMSGLEDIKLLFKYCNLLGILDKVQL